MVGYNTAEYQCTFLLCISLLVVRQFSNSRVVGCKGGRLFPRCTSILVTLFCVVSYVCGQFKQTFNCKSLFYTTVQELSSTYFTRKGLNYFPVRLSFPNSHSLLLIVFKYGHSCCPGVLSRDHVVKRKPSVLLVKNFLMLNLYLTSNLNIFSLTSVK